MAESAVHAIITGRVQGVGFRFWTEREAARNGLSGWVRNRRDGSVEAVFVGDAAGAAEMVALCRRGPPAASVTDVAVTDDVGPPLSGFRTLPTV
jgi:acylphosphatase